MPLPWRCLISSCPRCQARLLGKVCSVPLTLIHRPMIILEIVLVIIIPIPIIIASSTYLNLPVHYNWPDCTHFCWWRSPWQSYDNTFMQSNLILPKPMATLPILTHASCHDILPIIPFPQPRQTPCSKRQTNDIILQLMLQSHGGFQCPSSIPVATSSYLASTPFSSSPPSIRLFRR